MSYRRLHSQSQITNVENQETKPETNEKDQILTAEENMKTPDMIERYKAAFVLAGSCGSLSYRNGDWEGITEGILIQGHINDILGGVENLEVTSPPWRLPEEVFMHLATTNALIELDRNIQDRTTMRQCLKRWITRSREELGVRRDLLANEKLERNCQTVSGEEKSVKTTASPTVERPELGCVAAVRSLCVGLRYPDASSTEDLVRVAIETAFQAEQKLPLDFLGGVATAYFASSAVRDKDPRIWGWKFVNEVLPVAKRILEDSKKMIDAKSWRHFEDAWRKFLQQRGLETEQQCKKNQPRYPIKFGVKERDNFYKMISYRGSPGSSGHDAAIIAYDAILSCQGDWLELVCRAGFHGGRRSATGVIAATLFGAIWGFRGVCRRHLDELEHLELLVHSGQSLFAVSTASSTSSSMVTSKSMDATTTKKSTTLLSTTTTTTKTENETKERLV